MLVDMGVDHELAQRPLQPRQGAAQDDEARAGHLGRRREIHQAEFLADLEVFARRVRQPWLAGPTHLDIRAFVGAVGHVVGRHVGQAGEMQLKRGRRRPLLLLKLGHAGLDAGDFRDGRLGVAAFALQLTDSLGRLVAAGLELLQLGLDRAPPFVQGQEIGRLRRQAAAGHGLVKDGGVLTDPADIEHDATRRVGKG